MTGRRTHRPRVFRVCCLSVFLVPLVCCAATAQPAPHEGENYYKAKGVGIRVRWEVPHTTVAEGAELIATLVVSRATNPTEIVRPDLKALPAFADAFSVADVRDPPPAADAKEVRFTYKLKPRKRSVADVPEFEFRYFNPTAAPDRAFQLTVADAVAITVTEIATAATALPEPVPMAEADRLFEVVTGPEVLARPFVACGWAWLAAALFGPLAAGAWFLVWRRVFPDAARLAHVRRSRAARRAADAIRRANRTADPPAAIASAVLGYLRTRFPLAASAVTPVEIGAALVDARVPDEIAEQVADVFRACDRARFAPSGGDGVALAAGAQTVLARLEALA